MSWTNARIARLKEAWTVEGLSAKQIADEFQDVTRSSVIGKLHRLGLMGQGERSSGQQVSKTRMRRSRPPKTKTFINAVSITHRAELKPKPLPKAKPVPVSVTTLNVAFVDLKPHHCRWPLGERDFTYCGIDRREGRPYCEWHCGVAYETPAQRKKLAA